MEAAAAQSSPWDAVRAGLSTFLDACLEPSFRRIVVLDSVSVLQAKAMEVGIDPVELPMLRNILTPLLGTTTFDGMAVDALAHVALGGLYGASLYIARAPDLLVARAEVDRVLDTLISGLLGRPAKRRRPSGVEPCRTPHRRTASMSRYASPSGPPAT